MFSIKKQQKMKIAIIQFSPSGNTLALSKMVQNELELRNQEVQLIDITREKQFFTEKETLQYLIEKVKQHDVLLIGCPVYANHFAISHARLDRSASKTEWHLG